MNTIRILALNLGAMFYETRAACWGLYADVLIRRRNKGLDRIAEIDRLLATM